MVSNLASGACGTPFDLRSRLTRNTTSGRRVSTFPTQMDGAEGEEHRGESVDPRVRLLLKTEYFVTKTSCARDEKTTTQQRPFGQETLRQRHFVLTAKKQQPIRHQGHRPSTRKTFFPAGCGLSNFHIRKTRGSRKLLNPHLPNRKSDRREDRSPVSVQSAPVEIVFPPARHNGVRRPTRMFSIEGIEIFDIVDSFIF